MELIKGWLINIRDFFCIAALFLYLIPLMVVCNLCGIQLDD